MPTQVKSFTHQGMRKENQDALITDLTQNNYATMQANKLADLYAVVDGMGGHSAGRQAANEICNQIRRKYSNLNSGSAPLSEQMESMLNNINMQIYEMGRGDQDRSNWGATCSMLALSEKEYFLAHAGDTRIYLLRQGQSEMLTEDHNIAFQMYKMKQINYEEYQKSGSKNKLLSFVGMGKGFTVLTKAGKLQENDVFLLCSDGLDQFIDFEDMKNHAQNLWKKAGPDWFPAWNDFLHEKVEPELSKDNITWVLLR